MKLTPEEKKFYSRHLLLPGLGEEGQLKIKSARVLIVGAGGLGCPVLQYLAAAGIGHIGIADLDEVDETNLQRQVLFTREDIGKPKSECAAAKASLINPFIRIYPITEMVTAVNIRKMTAGYDLVIDCTDNLMARYLVNDACVISGIPMVFGSLYRMNGQVSVFNYSAAGGSCSANYRDAFPLPSKNIPDCQVVGVLNTMAGMIGTFQATEAIKIAAGMSPSLTNKLLVIDAEKMDINLFTLDKGTHLSPGTWEELEKYDYEAFCNDKSSQDEIDTDAFRNLLEKKATIQIIDVRETWETDENDFVTGHTIRVIPLTELPGQLRLLDQEAITVILCENGVRSKIAFNILVKAGFRNASILKGGWHSLRSMEV